MKAGRSLLTAHLDWDENICAVPYIRGCCTALCMLQVELAGPAAAGAQTTCLTLKGCKSVATSNSLTAVGLVRAHLVGCQMKVRVPVCPEGCAGKFAVAVSASYSGVGCMAGCNCSHEHCTPHLHMHPHPPAVAGHNCARLPMRL